MKLLGVEVEAAGVWRKVEERLRARGIDLSTPDEANGEVRVEPRIDPVQHHLEGLEQNGDPTRGLPLYTHRTGLGRAVVAAKWLFRKTCQPLINEALGRQRLFNGHVRDAYSELAARVERLAAEVEGLHQDKAKPAKKRKPAVKRKRGR